MAMYTAKIELYEMLRLLDLRPNLFTAVKVSLHWYRGQFHETFMAVFTAVRLQSDGHDHC